ncbi:MAG TPA: hypothetical protein VI796_07440 [Candidatus Thermoplasmatota archaeon]|nr:hypothetical protein [Candidatus Thermoplasmatota archaeon]
MEFSWWMVTAGANAVMVVVYGAIAVGMVRALAKGRQWFTNPILTATAAIFVVCTFGHGVHLEHSLLLVVGAESDDGVEVSSAARTMFADWRLLVWDGFTAVVALWYWSMRNRFAIIYQGAALCEDMAKRQTEARDLHDLVVQGLVEAKMALDLGKRDEGAAAVDRTLESAKRIITGLLGKEGSEAALGPGSLRREAAGR